MEMGALSLAILDQNNLSMDGEEEDGGKERIEKVWGGTKSSLLLFFGYKNHSP